MKVVRLQRNISLSAYFQLAVSNVQFHVLIKNIYKNLQFVSKIQLKIYGKYAKINVNTLVNFVKIKVQKITEKG